MKYLLLTTIAAVVLVGCIGVSILSYTHSPFGFSFDTGKDKSYTVEATGDLLKWNRVQTIQGTGSAVQFTDTRKALLERQYYRVKAVE